MNVIPLWLYQRILFFCWYRITDLWVCYIECLTCLRDNVLCLLTCSRLTCLACLNAGVLTCSRAPLPTCLACLRTPVLWLQITKKSFQWHTFLTILVLSLCFFLWNKTKYKMSWQARMSLETFVLRIQEFSQSYIPAILLPGGSLAQVMWQTLYSKMVWFLFE